MANVECSSKTYFSINTEMRAFKSWNCFFFLFSTFEEKSCRGGGGEGGQCLPSGQINVYIWYFSLLTCQWDSVAGWGGGGGVFF